MSEINHLRSLLRDMQKCSRRSTAIQRAAADKLQALQEKIESERSGVNIEVQVMIEDLQHLVETSCDSSDTLDTNILKLLDSDLIT
ncbi:hypothetical protein GZ77_26415 [Endozoicomonas montiporae]|uniref:Uncharacterized protein n=1 Tax=Endozoicomonas montiporae TaxID=1027273 RepID=A0A081MYG3_9GAMM|nr:hypothetical protein [Endozoicomonas montiporae]KEQ11236.1 hypothetical protein GZ77_26415 [Endozoicomonas montiporae]